MDRRRFLKTAAGLLVGATALAVPERRVWSLDKTMIPTRASSFPLPPGGFDWWRGGREDFLRTQACVGWTTEEYNWAMYRAIANIQPNLGGAVIDFSEIYAGPPLSIRTDKLHPGLPRK